MPIRNYRVFPKIVSILALHVTPIFIRFTSRFYASATKHLGIGMSVGLSVGRSVGWSVGFDTTFRKVQNVFI